MASEPIRYTARRDLRFHSQADRSQLDSYVTVFDPLTRQSYRVGELEHFILVRAQHWLTLTQLQRLVLGELRFRRLHSAQLIQSLTQLAKLGLLRQSQSDGTSASQNTFYQLVLSYLSSLVFWQLPGIQPDRWLDRLLPHVAFLFSASVVRAWVMIGLATLAGVLLDFHRLTDQFASWNWLLHPQTAGGLYVVFLITRALHELGHAISCKRFGIRVPDIGLFFILGTPCVYCDVSESARLSSRWQRAAVAAAGMYVELIVAIFAAWLWLMTIEGPVNTLAFQTMVVCSASTIVINANPLMRFDGYYILSDFLDEPNLRGRADAIATSLTYRLFLGRRSSTGRSSTQVDSTQLSSTELGLACFSYAGAVYRAGVSLAMASMAIVIYDRWHIAWFGKIVAAVILVSWWGMPMIKFIRKLWKSAIEVGMRWRLALLAGAAVLVIATVPIPYRQLASGWVQPATLQGIYTSKDARLVACSARSGQMVRQQQLLFQLDDLKTNLIATRLASSSEQAKLKLVAMRREQYFERTQSIDLSPLEAAVATAEQQSENANRALSSLALTAPCDGYIVVMPAESTKSGDGKELNTLVNRWDAPDVLGRLIREGTMLAAICSQESLAVIPLNDAQLQWISTGTEVRLIGACQPEYVTRSQVKHIVKLQEIAATWRLLNESNKDETLPQTQSTNAAYAAIIELPNHVKLLPGSEIQAAFVVPSQTLSNLAYDWAIHNLRWLVD